MKKGLFIIILVAVFSALATGTTVRRFTPLPGSVVKSTTGKVVITVTLGEDVDGLDATSLILSGVGGVSGHVTKIERSGSKWTFHVAGLTLGEVRAKVLVKGGEVEPFETSFWLALYDAPPEVYYVAPEEGETIIVADQVLTVTFSDMVTFVDSNDLQLRGPASRKASVGTPIYQGRNVWDFPLNGLSDGELIVDLAPKAGDIQDVMGNSLVPVSLSYTVDLSSEGRLVSQTSACAEELMQIEMHTKALRDTNATLEECELERDSRPDRTLMYLTIPVFNLNMRQGTPFPTGNLRVLDESKEQAAFTWPANTNGAALFDVKKYSQQISIAPSDVQSRSGFFQLEWFADFGVFHTTFKTFGDGTTGHHVFSIVDASNNVDIDVWSIPTDGNVVGSRFQTRSLAFTPDDLCPVTGRRANGTTDYPQACTIGDFVDPKTSKWQIKFVIKSGDADMRLDYLVYDAYFWIPDDLIPAAEFYGAKRGVWPPEHTECDDDRGPGSCDVFSGLQ